MSNETTHDIMVAQTQEAGNLLAYYQGVRDGIQADRADHASDVATAIADLIGIVSAEMSKTLYVDNTLTEAAGTTFPTIKGAIDSLPAGGEATLRLFTGQVHDLDADIDMKSRTISFAYQGALGLGVPDIRPLAYLSGGLNCMYGFSGIGYQVHIGTCSITLPTVEPDPNVGWHGHRRSVFLHTRAGARFGGLSALTVSGGVAGAGLGIISAYEATFASIGLYAVTLDGPINAVIEGANGVFTIPRTAVTLLNGAGLSDGGTIGVNFLQN